MCIAPLHLLCKISAFLEEYQPKVAFSRKHFENNHPHIHSLETTSILVCEIVKPFERAVELKFAGFGL